MPSLNKILYVEDEPDIQQVVKMTLESLGGFTIKICRSGGEAIEKAPGFLPELILLDVMMPGMDGPTTLQELRKLPETAQTAVIFMTAKAQAHEIKQLKALGAIDIITKPFDPVTLCDVIKKIWQKQSGQ